MGQESQEPVSHWRETLLSSVQHVCTYSSPTPLHLEPGLCSALAHRTVLFVAIDPIWRCKNSLNGPPSSTAGSPTNEILMYFPKSTPHRKRFTASCHTCLRRTTICWYCDVSTGSVLAFWHWSWVHSGMSSLHTKDIMIYRVSCPHGGGGGTYQNVI